ncbi:MAG: metallophosphoesterase, partial [bacterium]
MISIINAESPDIFILAGDTIDKRGNESLVGMFAAVKAKLAKLATLGNWEYEARLDLAMVRRAYERAGISLLVNTTYEVAGL